MATRPTLPYFAPPDKLPAPLPTVAEILASKQFMTNFQGKKHGNVVRIREHFIVKFGANIHLQEGENMLFVQQATSLPVPTVYALFHDKATGKNFIIQEYVQGQGLDKYWEKADHSGKEAVVTQLRHYFDELRSLPSPGYFGSVWRQPIREFYATGAWFGEKGVDPACDTEEQWVETLIRNAEAASPTKQPSRFEWIKRMFHSAFQGHDSVFTHCDLHPSNILVRDDNTVLVIDWANSGWYPSYVEYCNVIMHIDFETDLVLWVPRFLNEYAVELGWMFHLRSWIGNCNEL